MTQEEKAKRFDEVLAMAKDCITYIPDDAVNQYMLDMFPELKESEDERIRKALISAINNICAGDEGLVTFNGFSKEQVQSWLEKQSEQKPIDKCEGCNNVEGCVACVDGSEWAHIEKQKPFYHENANIQQKNFASIEPKFKVGDWVVTNKNNVVQIKAVNNGYYTIDNGMDFSTSYVDKYWRLWNIADAKSGDVLATLNHILIFEKVLSKDGGVSYCHYDFGSLTPQFNFNKNENWYFGKEAIVYPATKEQRDTLMKAMADAGYTFDFDKKELKKIEQNPADVEPKFHEGDLVIVSTAEGDRVVQIASVEYFKDGHPSYFTTGGRWFGSGTKARLLSDKDLETITLPESKIIVSQNPAWSEEDEDKFSFISAILIDAKSTNNCASNSTYYREVTDSIEWLKSLKDKHTWKPSEEQIYWLKWAIDRMPDTEKANEAEAVLEDLLEQLKKL